ncbi:MAG: EutN/CcmL family microcompartment protein [Firmicutes bacterium]|nr:EutN/CcmL family microcompartment protein [Bacillota bacterium]
MILCKVRDKCVSTIKNKELTGISFIIVEKMDRNGEASGDYLVAADPIGCGVGETVIITVGSIARTAISNDKAPIDAAVIGIVDSKEK